MGRSTKYFVSISTFFPVASDSFNSVIFLAFISFSFLDPSEQASDSLVMANDGKSQLMYMNMLDSLSCVYLEDVSVQMKQVTP